jgi:hypothetical protein
VPAKGRTLEARRVLHEEQAQLERLDEADVLELGGRRQRLEYVPAVEGSAEAVVRRALGGHEQMFPYP